VSFVAWHRPLRDRPRRYLLVSVGTIFRTDSYCEGFRSSLKVSFHPTQNTSYGFCPSQQCILRLRFHRLKARVRHTAKAMEGEGSPSNREDQAAPPEVAKAAAASSSATSSSESGKISGLDWSVALARAAVPLLPLVAMKVVIRMAGGMSK
jgi:hypothetical protein